MRTYISALVTLYTVFRLPNWNIHCNSTFLIFGGSHFPGSVFTTDEGRYRKAVTVLCINRTNYFFNEFRNVIFSICRYLNVCPFFKYFYFLNVSTAINSSIIHLNNILTLLTVRFNDKLLHLLDSKIVRNYIRNFEECRLKYCISSVSKTNFFSNLCSVNYV